MANKRGRSEERGKGGKEVGEEGGGTGKGKKETGRKGLARGRGKETERWGREKGRGMRRGRKGSRRHTKHSARTRRLASLSPRQPATATATAATTTTTAVNGRRLAHEWHQVGRGIHMQQGEGRGRASTPRGRERRGEGCATLQLGFVCRPIEK